MYKCNSAECAKSIASEKGLFFGMSALDGKWYAGNFAQLDKIGAAEIMDSKGFCYRESSEGVWK